MSSTASLPEKQDWRVEVYNAAPAAAHLLTRLGMRCPPGGRIHTGHFQTRAQVEKVMQICEANDLHGRAGLERQPMQTFAQMMSVEAAKRPFRVHRRPIPPKHMQHALRHSKAGAAAE